LLNENLRVLIGIDFGKVSLFIEDSRNRNKKWYFRCKERYIDEFG
jgi:hypothetical protein